MEQIQITVPGIKKSLRTFDFKKSLAEYIHNGFDAGASRVHVDFEDNGIGGITGLRVSDNGTGIRFDTLEKTFKPFFESQKELDSRVRRKVSAVQGRNGVGRLTFFKFAKKAAWHTVFQNADGAHQRFTIAVDASTLNTYHVVGKPKPVPERETGTIVEFEDIFEATTFHFNDDVLPYLKQEFGWFLELNKPRNFQLIINDVPLDYGDIIGDRDELSTTIEKESFLIRYVRWNKTLNKEYSHFYFVGSDDRERHKQTTTFNNKGDSFYHSVYVKSSFFDTVEVISPWLMPQSDDGVQLSFPIHDGSRSIVRQLFNHLNNFLHGKRLPFLKASADRLIDQYERNDVFPKRTNNGWDIMRHNQLQEFVRGLYQVEPRIFQNLSIEQKKTFTHMLNLIMAEGERESLLGILKEIIDLSPEEMTMLADILKASRLSGVIKTIRLIQDRYRAVEELKKLVFDKELHANEPKHIQKMVENHYWLFGEQYHLVGAAEQKFEENLRRYVYLLRGENTKRKIDHPDKQKEMDIFMVRQMAHGEDSISNVVVELKNPLVKLGEKELSQVKKYMRVILDQHEFNASNMTWDFYLVGNSYDTFIGQELASSERVHGKSVVFRLPEQYTIYVKTWSKIFTDFELRHNFLKEKLELERSSIVIDNQSADEIIASQSKNTAIQPPTITVTQN